MQSVPARKLREGFDKIGGQRSLELFLFPASKCEPDGARVKRDARKTKKAGFLRCIELVTNHRMMDRFEMRADLMRPSGFRGCFDVRNQFPFHKNAVVRHRFSKSSVCAALGRP